MVTPWNDDAGGFEHVLKANIARLVVDLVNQAGSRIPPTVAIFCGWHRQLFVGIPIPVAYYAGEVRDTDPRFPELIGYEVQVGSSRGTPSAAVPAQLARFEASLQAAVPTLDAVIPVGAMLDSARLLSVLRLMAIAHGEWIRIHPFANGNGRTARLIANWIALRYGLDAFVGMRPRPAGLLYAGAAMASMRRDHDPMLTVFHSMLVDYLAAKSAGSASPGP